MVTFERLPPASASRIAIAMIVLGMLCISVNDMTIKRLSGAYPLHEMVFLRSVIAIMFSAVFVHLEGGWRILWPKRPGLQILRALLIVFANLTYFSALAVLPLGTATALFFVAPLMITLLSIPVLGEQVGLRRLSACVTGFLGVMVIMLRPADLAPAPTWAYALPVIAAMGYAGMQVLTRALKDSAPASAMAVYIQAAFILVGAIFWLVAGDGRFAEGTTNPTVAFLFRAWIWPAAQDWPYLIMLGGLGGVIGYTMSQAYRLGDAATIAPFEYVALPAALIWGWLIWGEIPDIRAALGIAMILGSGLYVFLRERQRKAA